MPFYRPANFDYSKLNFASFCVIASYTLKNIAQYNNGFFLLTSSGSNPILFFDQNLQITAYTNPYPSGTPSKIFEGQNGRLFLCTSQRLYFSDDGGANWAQSLGIGAVTSIWADTDQNGVVLIQSINNTGRWVSFDNGVNFIATTASASNNRDSFDSVKFINGAFYCLSNSHISFSTDGTLFTDIAINVLYPTFGNPQAIEYFKGNFFVLANGTGKMLSGALLTGMVPFAYPGNAQLPAGVTIKNFVIGDDGMYFATRNNTSESVYLYDGINQPVPLNGPEFINNQNGSAIAIYQGQPIWCAINNIYRPLVLA